MSDPVPLVELCNVSRRYDGIITALQKVDLQIFSGEKIALLGSSGSGKTTLLSMVAGLETPTTGKVFLKGIDLRDWRQEEILSKHIGFLFQSFYLIGHLNLLENVELALMPTVSSAGERRIRSQYLLSAVGLEHRLHSPVRNLSGGERQRVAFCRAVANRPDLLVADEPTGNLDSKSSMRLLTLLNEHHQSNGATILVATHDAEVAGICDRIVHIEDGCVVE